MRESQNGKVPALRAKRKREQLLVVNSNRTVVRKIGNPNLCFLCTGNNRTMLRAQQTRYVWRLISVSAHSQFLCFSLVRDQIDEFHLAGP